MTLFAVFVSCFVFIKVSCTFMPVHVTCLHKFLLCNHRVTAFFLGGGCPKFAIIFAKIFFDIGFKKMTGGSAGIYGIDCAKHSISKRVGVPL